MPGSANGETASAASYPKRPSHYAHKVVRLLFKTCAAMEIGETAALLVVFVAHTEDAKRYSAPPNFFNDQLIPVLGLRKWKGLDRARQAAVKGGWLHYIPGGTHKAGVYWTMIPERFSEIDDTPLGETIYPPNGYNRGYNGGDNEGYNRGYNGGEHPSLFPNPTPDPEKAAPSSRRTKLRFTDQDKATAAWMNDLIRQMNPDQKEPKLDDWANTIRLIRERDKRTDEQIRALFSWVNAEKFWRTVVLSPAKLREKWDDLTVKMKHSTNGKPSATVGPGQKHKSENYGKPGNFD